MPAVRLVDVEEKATSRPSAEIAIGPTLLSPLPWGPPDATLTRSVVPFSRSRTNTSRPHDGLQSGVPLVSPGTRLLASDPKATKRPSAEIATSLEKYRPLRGSWPVPLNPLP